MARTPAAQARVERETAPERLVKRLDLAKSARRHIEPLLDECNRLYLPHRRGFFTENAGQDRAAEIYDETGANALQEYASRLHAGITPNFAKFALLKSGPDTHDADRQAVDRDLEEINDLIFDEIWESNFSQEVHESHLDMGISTGALLVEEGKRDLLHNTALPVHEIYLEAGPRDEIGGMFREREIKAGHLPALYPDGEFSDALQKQIDKEADKPLKVCDAIWTDHFSVAEAAYHAVFMTDSNGGTDVIRRKRMTGDGCNPFIGYRFGKSAGEIWGRGPAMNTLPAVRTMNLTIEMLLQNAAMSLIGMYHIDDDSVVNADTISLEPGAILPRLAGTRGLERIDTGAGDFRLSDILLNDQALKIRRGLFNDMLSDPNKTPATAQEVAERMADLSNRMAAAFGRLHFELLRPYIMRCIYLGEKRRLFKMPTLKGQRIKVNAISPLALAQGQRDLQYLVQYHQITAQILGPQGASAQYDEGELLPYLREKLSLAEKLFVSDEDMGKKMALMMTGAAAGLPTGGAQPGPMQN